MVLCVWQQESKSRCDVTVSDPVPSRLGPCLNDREQERVFLCAVAIAFGRELPGSMPVPFKLCG